MSTDTLTLSGWTKSPRASAGAEKHPGETWREIPAKEHAARAARHLSMWLAGDRDDTHLVNASMRCMMAWVMEREEEMDANDEVEDSY